MVKATCEFKQRQNNVDINKDDMVTSTRQKIDERKHSQLGICGQDKAGQSRAKQGKGIPEL